MCGILGYVGTRDGRQIIHQGLSRLEYRGYDSAGLALVTEEGLAIDKVVGRVDGLDAASLPAAHHGIGHTRWATHGAPTVDNAHPHLSCDGRIAVVHNGIITNEASLREELTAAGHTFVSETDTEVIAHLMEDHYTASTDIVKAARATTERLEGSYAFCIIHQDHPGELVATRQASPLVLGVGDGDETFVASDVVAFLEHTDKAIFLHDGDLVHVREGAYEVLGRADATVETIPWDLEEATLAGYSHFMLKEIHEQPGALRQALVGRVDAGRFRLEDGTELGELAGCSDVHLVACGSSYHAARVAASLLASATGLPARAHLASELGQRAPMTGEDPLFIAVTQSGETADTLESVRALRSQGRRVLAVTNVVGSTVTREASTWTPIRAGPELSVAATKSFTGQSLVLGLLAAHLAQQRGERTAAGRLLSGLRHVPHAVQDLLDDADRYRAIGSRVAQADRCFVLGSGAFLPVAMETALKIKEISYVHAEAFATGEMKHGPLALIEDGTPTLVHAPSDGGLERVLSTMQEVASRGADVIALTDAPDKISPHGFETLDLGDTPYPGTLFTATVAGQLIAYQAAVDLDRDVDRPRNLAKSVTVQ